MFEVASIRINNSDVLWPSGRVQSLPGGRVVATAIPVRELVRTAFGLGRWQEIRGPALLDRLVDLQAQAPQGYHTVAALESALPLLLRTLLIQRLQLSAREEIREAPVYELTLANSDGRLGPNMFQEETADCSGARAAALGAFRDSGQEAKNTSALMASLAAGRAGQTVDMAALGYKSPPLVCAFTFTNGLARAHSVTLTEFADYIMPFVDRPFWDRTMPGRKFTFTFTFDPQDPFINPTIRRSTAPLPRPEFEDRLPFVDALREQLGIRVRAITGPVASFVVERIELLPN